MQRPRALHRQRIFGLDLMRASAIVMVLAGHLTWILPKEFETVNVLLSLLGFLGVEVFFVLSGFLIGRILFTAFVHGDFSWPEALVFVKRRWFRTLPNYFLVLCANIAIGIGIIGYSIDGLWRYFLFLQNFHSAMPAFFPESWSLSVEEFAYILLPAALVAALPLFRKMDRATLYLIVIMLLIAVFIGLKLRFALITDHTTLAQWNLHLKGVVIYRVDAILTGAVASWLSLTHRIWWSKIRWLAGFAGGGVCVLLVFGVSLLGLGLDEHYLFWNVVFLPALSVAIALALPLLSAWKIRPYGVGKPIVLISRISYSMYLLHYGVVLQLLHHFVFREIGWQFTALLYFALTVVLSYLLYRFYEKPILQIRDRI